jgi:hypothetical protein
VTETLHHADPAFTARFYEYVHKKLNRDAADAMQRRHVSRG